jgi:hypothetical protein
MRLFASFGGLRSKGRSEEEKLTVFSSEEIPRNPLKKSTARSYGHNTKKQAGLLALRPQVAQ